MNTDIESADNEMIKATSFGKIDTKSDPASMGVLLLSDTVRVLFLSGALNKPLYYPQHFETL